MTQISNLSIGHLSYLDHMYSLTIFSFFALLILTSINRNSLTFNVNICTSSFTTTINQVSFCPQPFLKTLQPFSLTLSNNRLSFPPNSAHFSYPLDHCITCIFSNVSTIDSLISDSLFQIFSHFDFLLGEQIHIVNMICLLNFFISCSESKRKHYCSTLYV